MLKSIEKEEFDKNMNYFEDDQKERSLLTK
jgi:hypothetical protein